MSEQIDLRTLRHGSGQITQVLDDGQFRVTRDAVPVREFVPLSHHRFLSAAAAVEMFRGAPRINRDQLRTDLDKAVDQDPESRA